MNRQAFTTLRFRLMLSISFLIVMCILITSILGTMYYSRAIQEQNRDYTLQLLQQVQKNVDSYISSAEQALSVLSRDRTLLTYMRLDQDASEAQRLLLETEVRQLLRSYTRELSQTNGILVACENGRYLSNEFYRVTKDPLSQEYWYQDAVGYPSRHQIISKPIRRNLRNWKVYSDYDVIMLVKTVTDPLDGRVLGVVSTDLRLDEIESFLSDLTLGTMGTIFLLDSTGDVVYTPVNPLVYRVRSQWFEEDGGGSQFAAPVSGEDMIFLYTESAYTGWKTVGMFLQDSLPDSVLQLRRLTVLVGVFTLMAGVAFAMFLTGTVTRPIRNLQKLMRRAEEGDLNVQYQGGSSYEVDMLGGSFNTMIEKIHHLLSVVVEEQRNKRKAEMNALQAQIKPHFLYNTLDTISWMAKEYGARDIVELIAHLTRLFRISLSRGKEFITLGQELDQAKSYLYIQKIRYEDKLSFRFDVEAGLDDAPILKLILQPLIENAIYHGIKPKTGNGSVEVVIRRVGDDMEMQVIDDGVGLEDTRLEQLNRELTRRESHQGFGLFNVNERLSMHFGSDYGVTLSRNRAGGVTCTARHPVQRQTTSEGETTDV